MKTLTFIKPTNLLSIALSKPALTTSLLILASNSIHADELTTSVQQLTQEVQQACPTVWEDLGATIDPEAVNIWNEGEIGDNDKSAYIEYLASKNRPIDPETSYSNIDTIVANCTEARTALLSRFYSNLPQDVVAAMGALDYEPGDNVDGFEVGDLRYTGRTEAAKGWIFLHGQIIGPEGSTAGLIGTQYRELYEMAKLWHPNTGEESWVNGDTVQLPDAKGKTLVSIDLSSELQLGHGAGGQQATIVESTEQIGKTIGNKEIVLTQNNLPSHNHGTSGVHTHAMGDAGNHKHKLKSSVYGGSSAPQSTYSYFEGRARTNFQNAIQNAVVPAGNHRHTISNSGSHVHESVGISEPFSSYQPSILFNLEIKYK